MIGLVLIGARLYQPLWEREQVLMRTELQLVLAPRGGGEAERLEQRVAQLKAQASFVRDRRQRIWTVVELLDEISARLPDDSRAVQATIVDGAVTLLRLFGRGEQADRAGRRLGQAARRALHGTGGAGLADRP